MPILDERFVGLSELPRVGLCELPTPVIRMAEASARTGVEIWCKRDDLTSTAYGGNKVRKLEFLLGDAEANGRDALVTMGAWGSHHLLATAIHGLSRDFAVHGVVVPQPPSEHVERNLRADVAAGATLHPGASWALAPARMAAVATRLRLSGRRPYVIGPGGSSPVGTTGYVEAGLELAQQIDAGELPEPTHIYVAMGSGGTTAGLCIGLAAAGITAPVMSVRVTDRLVLNRPRMNRLVRRTVHHLRELDPRFPRVGAMACELMVFDDSQLRAGYGTMTEAARAAQEVARTDGLDLDGTYTAKALSALLRHATEHRDDGPLLFVNTLSSADLTTLLLRAPAPPDWYYPT